MTPEKLTKSEIERRIKVGIVDPALNRMGGAESFLRDGWRFDRVYELVIEPAYSVAVEEDCDLGDAEDGPILGSFDPVSNVARIDRRIGPRSGDPRRTFVRWHEVVGHGFLQGAWLRKQMSATYLIDTNATISDECRQVLERQANRAAACAAAPMHLVKLAIMDAFRPSHLLEFKGKAHYCLRTGRTQPEIESFSEFQRYIAACIQHRFDGLSVESLSYRVRESALVVDRSGTMPSSVELFRIGKRVRSDRPACFGSDDAGRGAKTWPSHRNKQRSA